MKQTGILRIRGTNKDGFIVEPIALSSIYFTQEGVLKLTARTDELGHFDFDLPAGKYRVEVNSGSGALLPLSLGNLFELKEDDGENAFEAWAEIPITDNDFDDRVLRQFKELADSASESATTATNAANNAETIITTVVEEKGRELDEKEAEALANIQALLESGQLSINQQIVDGNNALVITINNGKDELNAIASAAKESEINAENSAIEAKNQVDSIQSKLDEKQDILEFIGNGKVMKEGAYGIGAKTSSTYDDFDYNVIPQATGASVNLKRNGNYYHYNFEFLLNASQNNRCYVRFPYRANVDPFMITTVFNNTAASATIYTNFNTTVDSNGFIKKASPIIKLFDDHIEYNEQFDNEPIFEKISAGVYRISNTLGLAKEGWFLEIPKDRNGAPYFRVEWFQDEDNTVEIHVFEKLTEIYQENGKMLLREINGQPKDIAEDERWIDLRFHEEIKESTEDVEF